MSIPGIVAAQDNLTIFGYLASRYEKVWNEPGFTGGQIIGESAPGEFSNPSFNVMLQQRVGTRFKVYANLSGADASDIAVSNMWGEVALNRHLAVRFGRTYRKFGLYNEVLDAVPTYYGIEPPEMFDKDHLFLSRTTALMVHGSARLGSGTLSYATSTDNGEGDIFAEAVPVSIDANYAFGYGAYKIGFSAYTSGGPANSDVGVGSGSPRSGVLPWMAEDDFSVVDFYVQVQPGAVTLQFEYAQANHLGQRDPDAVVAVLTGTSVNDAQRARFLIDPAGPVDAANVQTVADYTSKTWYIRAGYSIDSQYGEFAPYLQWDWFSNPETLASKGWGGDNEAGVADDGVFNKATIGVVYRPIPSVALKLDGSQHRYLYYATDVSYPELRFDVSYTFGF